MIAEMKPRVVPENEQYHPDVGIFRQRVDAVLGRDWGCTLGAMPSAWATKFLSDAHEDKEDAWGVAYLMSQIHGRGLKGMAYTDKIRPSRDQTCL